MIGGGRDEIELGLVCGVLGVVVGDALADELGGGADPLVAGLGDDGDDGVAPGVVELGAGFLESTG